MGINIGNYTFDGAYSSPVFLDDKSGVYAVLGATGNGRKVLDIGESGRIKTRVSTHDRAPAWARRGLPLSYAAYYCDARTRMAVEQELRLVLIRPAATAEVITTRHGRGDAYYAPHANSSYKLSDQVKGERMTGQSEKKTTMDDIKSVAWAACNTFRGVIDPAEYKDYILIMLFLKFISDVWKQHEEEYREELKGDEVRLKRRMQRERFVMPEGSTFDELYDQRDADNIGELLNEALDAIEDANKAKLEGVFRNIDFNSQTKLGETKDRNRRVKNLLQDFKELDLRPGHVVEDDAIGEAYIYLIERFASDAGKKAGEFYTPRQVSQVLAKLVQPNPGDRICDPACGSGSLLIETAYEVGSNDFALFGQEVNGGTHALAKLNMFLHDIDGAKIEWGDTLNNPLLIEGDQLAAFDIVVANPPFSLKKWGGNEKGADGKPKPDRFNRWHRGLPPASTGDYAFISHMVEAAKPKFGRVAVVVPHGVLFRGGAEAKIRQKLIEENLLDAVIGLPANLFQSTSIPVAVLVFDRRREKGGERAKTTDVLFIDASCEFKQAKTQNILESAHTAKIIETFKTREDVEKYARVVPFGEIKENGFNLNIPRYVDTFEAEAEIDVKAVQAEIKQLEVELVEVKKRMVGYLRELGADA